MSIWDGCFTTNDILMARFDNADAGQECNQSCFAGGPKSTGLDHSGSGHVDREREIAHQSCVIISVGSYLFSQEIDRPPEA